MRRYKKWLIIVVAVASGVLLTIRHQDLLKEKELVKIATLPIPSHLSLVQTESFEYPFGKTVVKVTVNEFLRNASGTVYYTVYTRQASFNGIHDWVRLRSIQSDRIIESDWDSEDEIATFTVNAGVLQTYRYEFRHEKYLFWSWFAPVFCFGVAFVVFCTLRIG